MPNEFNIKNGFKSNGNSDIKGQLSLQWPITGNTTMTIGDWSNNFPTYGWGISTWNNLFRMPRQIYFDDANFTIRKVSFYNGYIEPFNNIVIQSQNSASGGVKTYLYGEQSTGNVGIGLTGLTQTPTAKLHVNNTTSGNTILFEDDTNPDSTPFVINSLGNVGVGILLPTEKLDVSGKTKTSSLQVTSGSPQVGYVLTATDTSGNMSWDSLVDSFYLEPSSTGVTWNVSGNSTNYKLTLTANTTLNLTNVRNGEYGTIILIQDSGGNRTLTLGTLNGSPTTHKVVNGGSLTLTSTANAIDILSFVYDGSVFYWNKGLNYV